MRKLKITIAVAALGLSVIAGTGVPTKAAPLSTAPLLSVQLADQMKGGVQNAHYLLLSLLPALALALCRALGLASLSVRPLHVAAWLLIK